VPDNTPIYDVLFQMQIGLCNRFTQFTPLSLRREKAREVFTLIVRYNRYSKEDKKKNTLNGKRIIRKPASDNWF
jgi:hypothetical protein